MNVGAQFLREHVTSDVRIHYSFTEAGGGPNIVPDRASVWYFVRALSREAVEDVYARLVRIAKGAAMMTDTEVTEEFLGGCYNTLQNKVLVNVIPVSYTHLDVYKRQAKVLGMTQVQVSRREKKLLLLLRSQLL